MDQEGSFARRLDLPSEGGIRSCQACVGERGGLHKASRWLWAALIGLGICHSVAAQQRRWAALDPNGEGSSPVAWGATEEEARQRALEACKKVSKTCANGPAPRLCRIGCGQPPRGGEECAGDVCRRWV